MQVGKDVEGFDVYSALTIWFTGLCRMALLAASPASAT